MSRPGPAGSSSLSNLIPPHASESKRDRKRRETINKIEVLHDESWRNREEWVLSASPFPSGSFVEYGHSLTLVIADGSKPFGENITRKTAPSMPNRQRRQTTSCACTPKPSSVMPSLSNQR